MGCPVVVKTRAPRTRVRVQSTIVKTVGGTQGPPGLPASAAVQAGTVLPAAFAGSPLTASIVLPDLYPDANYSIATQITTSSGRVVLVNATNYTAAGFDLELCSQNLDGIAEIRWQTTPYN